MGQAAFARTKFDEGQWPVVVATLPRVALDGDAFEEHCRVLYSYFARQQSFVIVFDAREAVSLNTAQRRRLAELTDSHNAKYPNVEMMIAVAVSSSLLRGVVKVVNWLKRTPSVVEFFATPEEAIAWGKRMLASRRGSEQAAPHHSPRT